MLQTFFFKWTQHFWEMLIRYSENALQLRFSDYQNKASWSKRRKNNCIASCQGHMPFTCISLLILMSALVASSVAVINTVTRVPWGREGLFGLTAWGYSPLWQRSHSSKSLQWLVTLHLQSGSLQGWALVLRSLSAVFSLEQEPMQWSHSQLKWD